MKYLRRFNESNTSDIILNIKDILLPISDMGYEISVTEDDPVLIIRVVVWTNEPLLMTHVVKDDFIRMKEYLISEGYDSIMADYYYLSTGERSLKEFDDFINTKDPITNLLFVAKKSL